MRRSIERDEALWYAAERQNMVADIAHELRTPVSMIQSNLEAMLDGVLPASPEELTSLHQETLLLNWLIGDLRTLSLAEAGQQTPILMLTARDAILDRINASVY